MGLAEIRTPQVGAAQIDAFQVCVPQFGAGQPCLGQNRSGEAPARTRSQAARCCDGRPGSPILLDLPGAEAGGGNPSSVLDVTGPRPRMLREGAISSREVTAVLEENPFE